LAKLEFFEIINPPFLFMSLVSLIYLFPVLIPLLYLLIGWRIYKWGKRDETKNSKQDRKHAKI